MREANQVSYNRNLQQALFYFDPFANSREDRFTPALARRLVSHPVSCDSKRIEVMQKIADPVLGNDATLAAALEAVAAQRKRLRLAGGGLLLGAGGLCLLLLGDFATDRCGAVAATVASLCVMGAALVFWRCDATLARAGAIIDACAADLALSERQARLTARIDRIEQRAALVDFISHKLRTPLTTLDINLHRLVEAAGAGAQGWRQNAERADRAAKKIMDLIEGDFLAFGRLDLLAPRAQIDMRAFLEDIVRRENAARARGPAVVCGVETSAPAALDPEALGAALAALLAELRHGAARDGSVTLQGAAAQTHYEILIDGPAPPEREAESPATAVFRRVVEAHGGTLAFSVPLPGKRRVTATLPLGETPETKGEISS